MDAFLSRLAEHHTFVTYDKHGTGLSDRDRTEFTLEAERRDLETAVDHLGLKEFDLLGLSEGGPVAISYAVLNPGRVRRLVLYSTFADGPSVSTDEFRESFIGVVRSSWGFGSKMLMEMLAPGASAEQMAMMAKRQRATTSPQIAAAFLEHLVYRVNVSDLLPAVEAPTLVVQRRNDRAFSLRHSRQLAAGIPTARLQLLEGDQHAPFLGDVDALVDAIHAFLAEDADEETRDQPTVEEGSAFRTIVFTDIEGHTAMMARLGDARGREVLREHERRTRQALADHGGTEIKTDGDGFMASFGSAQRALECAIALQRAFDDPVEGEQLAVRIGVNAGEPVAEENDLFGASVIAAARVSAMATGGQVLVSNVVRELVAGKGFLFSDIGEHALRGLEDTVRLWELRRPE
jgi:class 3 adenylate cyclase